MSATQIWAKSDEYLVIDAECRPDIRIDSLAGDTICLLELVKEMCFLLMIDEIY